MAIILSTVAVYFVLNLANERTRASYEIQSQQENLAKSGEKLTVVRDEALDCTPGPDCFISRGVRAVGVGFASWPGCPASARLLFDNLDMP